MTGFLIDTNCLLRYLLNDIPKQADIIERYLLQAKNGEITITIPLLIIGELIYALTKFYKYQKKETIERLNHILMLEYIEVEKKEILIKALQLYSSHNISFVDSLFYVEAKIEGKELLTFDKRLKEAIVV